MAFRGRLPPPSYAPAMFVILMLTLAAALYWLSWRLLLQDRALENERVRERLEHSVDLACATLRQSMSETEARLAELAALTDARLDEAAGRYGNQLPEDTLLVVLRPDAVAGYPKGSLPYYPVLPERRRIRLPRRSRPERFSSSARRIMLPRLPVFASWRFPGIH